MRRNGLGWINVGGILSHADIFINHHMSIQHPTPPRPACGLPSFSLLFRRRHEFPPRIHIRIFVSLPGNRSSGTTKARPLHATSNQTTHYGTKTSSFNNTWWRQENTISPNETPLSPFHTSSIPCSHHSRYPSMDHSSKLPSTATLRYASQSPNRTTLHLPINLSQQHIPTFNTKLLIIALPKPRHFHQIPNLVNSLTILVPTFLHRTFHTPPDATLPAKTFSFSPSINVKVKYQPHA